MSDPQERAWYDSHQNILFNAESGGEEHYQRNVKVTTAEDLAKMCLNRNAFSDFSDATTGFFTIVREVFERLALEENLACEIENLDAKEYPSFGSAKDIHEGVVRPFYLAWSNFATQKSFSWEDRYRYSDAPDRRIRRAMEKENRLRRNERIKEFNEAVRTLVGFVKRRDPRYAPSSQNEAERHKSMRERAAAQAVQARAANQAKIADDIQVAAWAQADNVEQQEHEESPEEEPQQQFECVVCNKTFKSEKQYEAHEKSRKHIKATQRFKREMRRENAELCLDEDNADTGKSAQKISDLSGDKTPSIAMQNVRLDSASQDLSKGVKAGFQEELLHSAGIAQPSPDQRASPLGNKLDESSSDTNEEYAPRSEVESRILGSEVDRLRENLSHATLEEINELSEETLHTPITSKPPKMGKAKEKRAKKAVKNEAGSSATELKCATCHASFPSKTKLFNHINELQHARPIGKSAKHGKRR